MSGTLKRESELKNDFIARLKLRFPAMVVFEFSTAGAPDRAFAMLGRVTFWEFKHATPACEFQDIQLVTCMRLEQQVFCRYVIWEESARGDEQTCIVRPSQVKLGKLGRGMLVEAKTKGFDHQWLLERVWRAHSL